MLKIKDNVDLKELEKYGFELQEDWWNRPTKITKDNVEGEEIYCKHVAPYTSIEIEIKTRRITEQQEDMFRSVEERYIDDLIKDGLVTKID